MKFRKIESTPETTTFGSLQIGTKFILQNSYCNDRILIKTRRGWYNTEDGTPWNFNCICLMDNQLYLTQDIDPVYIVECVLEFKVVG